MAATDQPYRRQRTLDIVFAVSCILMLLSVIVMFAEDYYRPFKVVQREFRDVEEAVFQRAMLDKLPDDKTLKAIEDSDQELAAARKALADEEEKIQGDIRKLRVDRVRLEADLQSVKATYDSLVSLRNIDADEGHTEARKAKEAEIRRLEDEMRKIQDQIDDVKEKMDEKRAPIRAKEEEEAKKLYANLVKRNLAPPARTDDIKTLSQCEDPIRKATADLDRFAKITAQKKWKFGDWVRALPVIDGFASPYQIQQFTLDKLPIDYNFKHVTRYDRCHTCHLGIDRAGFDRDTLTRLKDAPGDLQGRLDKALALFQRRQQRGEGLGFDPDDLAGKVNLRKLTDAEITQYAAHPRLDLFVDSNSPHGAEKFGCTICHSGQGSATEFNLAAHSPNDAVQKKKWEDEHHWHRSHYWDFPMLPGRFVESSCLKCHHEVTDLVRYGSRVEAPKLFKGYNLFRENGCFGCHEVAGMKGGRPVGPDMRLEPSPPLEALTAAERTKMLADALNPPGKLRKVGPSLYRLAEKTNETWTREWIHDPRGFRPDTRMPHFYGLSNNHESVLPKEQKGYPAAEIHAITHYLFRESQAYLEGRDKYRQVNEARQKELAGRQKDGTISERERKELIEVERRLELAKDEKREPLLTTVMQDGKAVRRLHLIDGENNPVAELPAPADEQQRIEGARLFREKGCLACHSHDGTDTRLEDSQGPIPAVMSDADFGPNLSRLAAKIAPAEGSVEARRAWLVQWIMNPNIHFPRTRMPITHLSAQEAARIADWLLSQPAVGWEGKDVAAPSSQTLIDLARVYLLKAPGMTRDRADKALGDAKAPGQGFEPKYFTDRGLPLDSDERVLIGPIDDDKLKYYIGKKAINRQGCFGCHSIPGFEFAKPIGTPLNDWGKKDPERLAFEDAAAFVRAHFNYQDVLRRDDPKQWKAEKSKDGRELSPYERYFYDSLHHHQREGFLHLKLLEPRSYDYNRDLKWDDRLRMPQFRFAHVKKRPDEDDQAFRLRASREEAEAREAVMTFVLGLVAEPIPLSYLYTPPPDRLAEARGRQVLDKFNCGGCHQVRSGVYEFGLTPGLQQRRMQGQLQESYDAAMAARGKSDYQGHREFRNDNAWEGLPQPYANRLLVHGIPGEVFRDDEQKLDLLPLWLTQAVRFTPEGEKKPADMPAGETANLPLNALVSRADPYGGAFTELMVKSYVGKPADGRRSIPKIGPDMDERWARSALPPPLIREGERVQPEWLYRFLLNPGVIRPQQDSDGIMFLRMPRFNMSEEEAQTLVNYFGAADRIANPGVGLTYPYLPMKQREEEYWQDQNKEYVKHLTKEQLDKKAREQVLFWTDYVQDESTELKRKLKAAEAAVQAAKEAEAKAPDKEKDKLKKDVAAAEKARKVLEEQIKKLEEQVEKKEFPDLRRRWERHNVYAGDAYRLLVGQGSPCLSCHTLQGAGETKAPPLELAHGRLRPDWTLRWLAFPRRLFAYDTPMTPNFPHDQKQYQNLFEGPSLEQARAARDILMNFPKEAALPSIRYYREVPGGN